MARQAVSESSEAETRDRRRTRPALAASAALGAGVALLLASSPPLRALDAFAADVRISLFGSVMPERRDLAIVAVDEAALARLPFRSPVDRAFLADLVRAIDERGARVIGIDLPLDRPTRAEDDDALARALERARAEIVLVAEPPTGIPLGRACSRQGAAAEPAPPAAAFRGIGRVGDGVLCADDLDGVFRHDPEPSDATAGASFADAVAEAAGLQQDAAPSARGARRARLARGARGDWPFPTYGATGVGGLPADALRDRIVLVGMVTPSDDLHLTALRFARLTGPIEPADLMPRDRLPGVVVQAYLIAQRLDGATGPGLRFSREAALALLAAGLAVALVGAPWPARTKATVLASGVAGYWLLALFAFAATGALLGLSAFSVALLVTAGLAAAAGGRFGQARRRPGRAALAPHSAPRIVADMVRKPVQLSLAAQEREISVLFADLESFTHFADTHDPALVTRFLNDYFDRLIGVVHAHGGTVDKIMGDSINAFFSAPIADPDHRAQCVRCALAMDRAAREVSAAHAQHGDVPRVTRLGVHAGRALVGNFGGGSRFDYTAQGSTMNLASRLERANKIFRTRICVSAAARADADGLAYRTIGLVRLRGFAEPIAVFEPLDAATADAGRLGRYEAALAVARDDPAAARAAFEALATEGEDALVAFQIERLEAGLIGEVIEA